MYKNLKKNYAYREVSKFRNFKQAIEETIAADYGRPAYRYKVGKEITDVSFEQFYADSKAFGTALAEKGLEGGHIAIVAPNSYRWIVTMFTVVNGSGVLVPIDKELPVDDMVRILNDGDVETIVYAQFYEEKLLAKRAELPKVRCFINIEAKEDNDDRLSFAAMCARGEELLAAGNTAYTDIEPAYDKLKLLVYTSGTTGNPKGVMLSLKNLVCLAYNGLRISTYYETGLSVLPYHHTYELVCHILVSIKTGATICINESLRSVAANFKIYQPTHTLLVPMIVEKFYKTIWQTAEDEGKADALRRTIKVSNALLKTGVDLRPKFFKSIRDVFGGKLRKIICGGAPLRAEIADFFEAIGITLMNGYGITECSPLVSGNRDYFYCSASVGSPLPCLTIKIEQPNENGEGEICVKGDTVMMGYYKQPEKTAEVMDADGFFHTGDYGRMGEDERLYITGRKKNMIVLRNGKNIYPEEIEDMLSAMDGIAEVIVSAVKDETGAETALQAEIYPEEKLFKDKSAEEISAAVKAIIGTYNDGHPVYKKITKITVRQTPFEKTTSGKIKRNYAK